MTSSDFPFVALTQKQLRIVKTYEYVRHRADGQSVSRKVAVQLGYKISPKTRASSYVNDVLRKWAGIKRELDHGSGINANQR